MSKIRKDDEASIFGNQFQSYLNAFNRETDMGKVLVCTAHMEFLLKVLFSSFLVKHKASESLFEGPNAPFGSFSARLAGAVALGLMTDAEYQNANQIRKIRNEFAHELTTTFETRKIVDMCSNLTIRFPESPGDLNSQGRFMEAAIAIIVRLHRRTGEDLKITRVDLSTWGQG